MSYTISEAAERMGVSVHTLRFYDKEGLLPHVKRVNGRRIFAEEDFAWLQVLNCLKNTGMPLKEIRRYLELCQMGDDSLKERQEIILRQRDSIQEQIRILQENQRVLDYKVWYYETAVAAGTEHIHAGRSCNPTIEPAAIPSGTAPEPKTNEEESL